MHNNPQQIITNALDWAKNSPKSVREIIEWSDESQGVNKFFYTVHLLDLAAASFQRPLRIAICGENNAGKSSLVNALIREEIAITDFLEFTFCPMVFSYGNTSKAKIVDRVDAEISLNLEDLETKLRSIHAEKESERIKRVEITTSKPYLKKYQIADVPGVGADERNAKIAQAFTEEIDVVIFVINASILGQSELNEDIKKLAGQFANFCLVINKIDQIGYENAQQAIEFVASMSMEERKILIFPMATKEINSNTVAQQWLDNLETEFLLPVAQVGDSIKVTQALEKCYRQLSTMSIFLQSTYHQAYRYSRAFRSSCKILNSKAEKILTNVDAQVQEWVSTDGFSDLIQEYGKELKKSGITSETKARERLKTLLEDIDFQKEVKNLISTVKAFIEGEIYAGEAKIEELNRRFFAPFQIEQTSHIFSANNPSRVIYNVQDGSISERKLPKLNPDSEKTQNSEGLFMASILTSGIVDIAELVIEATLLPIVTAGLSFAIPAIRLISSNWDRIASWVTGGNKIDEEKLERDLEQIRFNLAEQVAKQVFPEGAAKVIKPHLEKQLSQWKEKVKSTLWSDSLWDDPNFTQSQEESQFVSKKLRELDYYTKQGEELRRKTLEALRNSSQVIGDRLSDLNYSQLSPAACQCLELFKEPQYYLATEADAFRQHLTSIIELEEIQLNFIDRHCSANELRWLSSIATSNAFIQGWVYDVELDSQNRVDFVKALSQEKINRGDGIAVHLVKYSAKKGTPLNRYLICGMDWVIELSQSLREMGKKDMRVWAIANPREKHQVFQLIQNYSNFQSDLQYNKNPEVQSLTLS